MRRRAGRGALVVLALMFFISGGLRLGGGLGAALALAAEGVPADGAADTGACPPLPADLARALSEREARVLVQEAALADRVAAVALAEAALDGRLEALAEAEAGLRATLAIADGAAEADLSRLTAVYETMKPKDAAALFQAMDPGFAAGFLGRMRPDAAAAVLAGLSPDRAYEVSAILAGRNSTAPKE